MSDDSYMEFLLKRDEAMHNRATPAPVSSGQRDIEPPPEGRADHLLAGMKTGAWLSEQNIAPLQMMIPHLIPEGSGLIIGPPKLGKSYMTLQLALSVTVGMSFLGMPRGPRRPVLLMALEDIDRRVKQRASDIGFGPALDGGDQFMYFTEIEEDALNYATAWLSLYGETKPLVIVDTFRKGSRASMQRSESVYQFDYRVAGEWHSLAKRYPGSTILLVHHTRKMKSDDWMDGSLGSQGLNGAVDFTLRLDGKRGAKEGLLMGTGRDLNDFLIRLERSDTGAWLLGGDNFEDASRRAHEVQQSIALSGDERAIYEVMQVGVSYRAGEIAAMTGLKVEHVRVSLGRLVEKDYLQKAEGQRGVYSRRETSAGGDKSC